MTLNVLTDLDSRNWTEPIINQAFSDFNIQPHLKIDVLFKSTVNLDLEFCVATKSDNEIVYNYKRFSTITQQYGVPVSIFDKKSFNAEEIIQGLKAVGVIVSGQEYDLSKLQKAINIKDALLDLALRGLSLGVSFQANMEKFNNSALQFFCKFIGFTELQTRLFLSNIRMA